MCYVIVTCRSLLWTLLSIIVCLTELSAFMSSQWLVSEPYEGPDTDSLYHDKDVRSIGLFIRCIQTTPENFLVSKEECHVYTFNGFASAFWAIGVICMGIAIAILILVALFSISALCFRSLGKKSIFSVSGLLQGIAGLLLIITIILFPAGWGSSKVQYDCGIQASAFQMGSCHLGWSFWAAVGGTVGAFLCALLSHQAEASAVSKKVKDDIMDGKNPVCAV